MPLKNISPGAYFQTFTVLHITALCAHKKFKISSPLKLILHKQVEEIEYVTWPLADTKKKEIFVNTRREILYLQAVM